MSDFEKEDGLLQNVESLLGKVLPLAIVSFLMITAAVIILAWASWIGAALFQLPAKDSLSTYTGPVILLSLGITLVGAFLSYKLTAGSTPRHKEGPVKPLAEPSSPRQFTHVLIPGGKDAEEFHPKAIPNVPTLPATAFKPLHSAPVDISVKPEQYPLLTSTWASPTVARPFSGPPDRLEPRITAFSFNCQECKGTINLPWEIIRKAMGNDQLQVDCPHCHHEYPFDYERAERRTLSITFSGIIRQGENSSDAVSIPSPKEASKTFEDKEAQVEKRRERLTWSLAPAVEPVQAAVNTAPSDPSGKSRFAGLAENRVGEAARAIRDSSKLLVGSFSNNRFFQTMASRLQPGASNASWTPGDGLSGGKFTHVLVPGGKEGDSLSQVIPGTTSKTGALTASADFGQSHRTFEDMPNGDEPGEKPTAQPVSTAHEVSLLAPPDRLSVHIDAFSFNCQDCRGVVSLPWARVEAGSATPQFPVDCPNCHHQYPFNYEQAKRKTLTLMFKPFVENPVAIENQVEAPKKSPDPEPELAQTPNSVQDLKPVQVPSPALQEPKLAQQVPKEEKRTSPGMEYDRAILEKG